MLAIAGTQLDVESGIPEIFAKPLASGLYEPAAEGDPDGIPMMVLGVSPDGLGTEPIDLVAWQLSDPGLWWLRCGRATHLGDGELWRPLPQELADRLDPGGQCPETAWRFALELVEAHRRRQRPVLLVENPSYWLHEACGRAVCILDWARADVVDMFHGGRPLIFQSERLRRTFDRRWGEIVETAAERAVPRYKVVT